MVRLILALMLAVFALPASAQVSPGDLKLELSFEELPAPPHVGEMILLKVRGEYKIQIARETLKQTDLDGFDWMQLGEDTWTEDTTKGRRIVEFERIIALFPNRAGPLKIEPFRHELELWTLNGRRYDHVVTSDPIEIEVQEKPETDDWWLPARRITVTDDWSNPPDKLGPGEGALRVVAVTVEGVRPEQIPQMPELGSAGAFVFAHPEYRRTRLYKRGPVTRVFWRWTVRPENPPSAYLKPIRLPYFDTTTREHKEIVIAAQRIAMTEEAVAAYLAEAAPESVAAMQKAAPRDTPVYLRYAGIAAPVALLGGLLGGLALLLPGMRLSGRRQLGPLLARLKPDPDIKSLKRATAHGGVAEARAAAVRLISRDEGDTDAMREALAALDGDIFAAQAQKPDLKTFARIILKARKSR